MQNVENYFNISKVLLHLKSIIDIFVLLGGI